MRISRTLDKPRLVATAVNSLAQLERTEGQLEAAEVHYAETVRLAHQVNDEELVAVGLLNLAMVAVRRGQGQTARATLLKVMHIIDSTGSRPLAPCVLDVCAGLAAIDGDWQRAARYYGLAEAQNNRLGLSRDPADAAFLAPMLETVGSALGDTGFAATADPGNAEPFEVAWAVLGRWLRLASINSMQTDRPA